MERERERERARTREPLPEQARADERLVERIARHIEREAGLDVVVEQDGNTLVLSGIVDSAEARQTAETLVRQLAPGLQIDNGLEIETVVPEGIDDLDRDEPTAGVIPDDIPTLRPDDQELAPDFTNQPLMTANPIAVIEEGEETYFPPTDPVVTVTERGDVEVLGGLSPTSTEEVEVAPSASDTRLGDEAIAEAVRRELRQDASTTALRIQIAVREGVVYLRVEVEGPEDAENAEAVASTVPGVVDVVDELRVRAL